MFESILRLVVDFLTEFKPVGNENELMHIINTEIIRGTDKRADVEHFGAAEAVKRKKLSVAVIVVLILSKKMIEDKFWECLSSLGLKAKNYRLAGLPCDAAGSQMEVLPATIRLW